MRVLALDLSSKTGWALIDYSEGVTRLLASGLLELGKTIAEFGIYPWSFKNAAAKQAEAVSDLVQVQSPNLIVIEETNLGRNRYSQKFLEFLHCEVLRRLGPTELPVRYISSSSWRKTLEIGLSKEDRKSNEKLSRAKSAAKRTGKRLNKTQLGIRGRINKKHLAVRWANQEFGLQLKMKDNDIADAICLGVAFLRNAPICDGK